MARRFAEDRLVVATHNEGKAREIAALLAPYRVDVVSAKALNLPEPEETGQSFAANAILKAKHAAAQADMPALADDSGLEVTALSGAPGIQSARWAGPERDFAKAMARVEAELRKCGATGPNQRRARFVAALALAWPDGHVECFEGEVNGTLVFPPRGDKGFGYDPVFQPDGYTETFGEMAPDKKHRISHRAHAFAQLVAACFAERPT
jgi:XTP/dITP diphosphohydrolase